MSEKRIWTGMGRYVPGLGKELAALTKHPTLKNCWVGMMGNVRVIAAEGTCRPIGSNEEELCLTLFEDLGVTADTGEHDSEH
jgi:hypothetical protein